MTPQQAQKLLADPKKCSKEEADDFLESVRQNEWKRSA
jgi:hypothetical protein